jgi:hypothetical protein
MSNRLRSLAINVGGIGLGLIWIWRDETQNPRLFKIPKAEHFPKDAIHDWNLSTGPKGNWAVPLDVIEKPETLKITEPLASTW